MFDQCEPERIELTAELTALERQLTAMTPAAPRIDRDRLMFEAGRAGARPRRPGYIAGPSRAGRYFVGKSRAGRYVAGPSWAGPRFWPAATATMTAATLLLATMLVWQRHSLQIATQENTPSIVTTQAIEQHREMATHSVAPSEMITTGWRQLGPPTSGYLGIRYVALTRGVGALDPIFPATSGDHDSSRDIQRTQRDMLNELLPSAHREANPRS